MTLCMIVIPVTIWSHMSQSQIIQSHDIKKVKEGFKIDNII